ncbi:unnamed protein product [Vitrella brassicaformis CCMP3155]|uniref:Uncharacterized protein n=1 Tax=Vitrella brassicaformis (strain CCMP3155) TaxID=1169540 RepID=A0A0G4GW03_VITBC|nr:unnamed protein product [Vitrella brassicaformis CCMP3155]|eukprot:CEM35140.1 unnamed protein product [Vitrella brassicaformis CCMP3155]
MVPALPMGEGDVTGDVKNEVNFARHWIPVPAPVKTFYKQGLLIEIRPFQSKAEAELFNKGRLYAAEKKMHRTALQQKSLQEPRRPSMSRRAPVAVLFTHGRKYVSARETYRATQKQEDEVLIVRGVLARSNRKSLEATMNNTPPGKTKGCAVYRVRHREGFLLSNTYVTLHRKLTNLILENQLLHLFNLEEDHPSSLLQQEGVEARPRMSRASLRVSAAEERGPRGQGAETQCGICVSVR